MLDNIRLKESQGLSKGAIPLSDYFGISGIYFLFKDRRLVYIGESSCVFSRLAQHFKNPEKEFDSFKFEPFNGSTKQRQLKEKKLIKRYRPILNYIHNS